MRLGLRFGMTGRLLVDGAASIDRPGVLQQPRRAALGPVRLRFTDGTELRLRDPGASAA